MGPCGSPNSQDLLVCNCLISEDEELEEDVEKPAIPRRNLNFKPINRGRRPASIKSSSSSDDSNDEQDSACAGMKISSLVEIMVTNFENTNLTITLYNDT